MRESQKFIRILEGGGRAVSDQCSRGTSILFYKSLPYRVWNKNYIFPCSKYNLSQISEKEVNKDLRRRCSVLHLKGNRKGWVEKLVQGLAFYGF